MLIKKLTLPSGDEEELALLNGAAIIGMPRNCQNFLPFGVFPPKCVNEIEFGDITIFSGSMWGIRTMLNCVLRAKLSDDYIPLYGMSNDTLREFCKLCEFKYGTNIKHNDFDFIYVDKESIYKYAEKKYSLYEDGIKWSVLDCFEKFSEANCFVIVDTPEDYMSFHELCVFAEELEVLLSYQDSQFVLLTNSPVLFGIKDALLYDLDTTPVLPHTWWNFPLIGEYKKYCSYTAERHTYKKK